MKITEPGIYLDVPSAVYFGDPCPVPSLTQSIAKILIERSPAHAKLEHPRLTPPSPDDEAEKYVSSQAIGNAAHKLMLGRGKEVAIIEAADFRSKAAQALRDEANAAGVVPILAKHFARADAMVRAGRAQLAAAGLSDTFADGFGQSEVTLAWCEGDLWFRSLVDWMTGTSLLVDYKSTGLSVAPHAIPMMMVNAGWDVQAAMHERGLDVLDPDGRGRRRFRFIAIENAEPYALTVCEMTEAVLTMGRKKLAFAVEQWAACMASGKWPAYPAEVFHPQYPSFKENQWLDREIEYDDSKRRAPEPMPRDLIMAG
ncbi:MAG: PD-(D/E)XK nuclease-like domain-containing protein [Alphaproteobacteria bacterium]|nr:PD-(D/E)XK nuclease-like domain-containing protein [Alphaproteobacteria bacterium]